MSAHVQDARGGATPQGAGRSVVDRLYRRLDTGLTAVLLVLVVAMVLSITLEILLNAGVQPVVARLIRGAPSPADGGTARALARVNDAVAVLSAPLNTASQSILVWIGILGSALALRRRAHLGVDALVRIYPPRARVLLDRAATLLVGLFSLTVLVIGGASVCQKALATGSRMPGFEMLNAAWFYAVLVITGALHLAYCVYHWLHPVPAGGPPGAQTEAAEP